MTVLLTARSCLAVFGMACLCGFSSGVRADVRALVIGIDEYARIGDLDGAVNDALDIASALRSVSPVELRILLNDEATREGILSAWREIIASANPGDTVFVTYAGHGGSEPAAYPETEADGRDETFLLHGFSPEGPNVADRIRDDEIAALVARRTDINHIFVADSCHSGTATRSSRFDLSYRYFDYDQPAADPLPPAPLAEESTQSHLVYFGAVGDSELVPEVRINGQARGALSYAVAGALRGAADTNVDGTLTKGEFERYVRQTVQRILDGRQTPHILPAGLIDKPLLTLAASTTGDGHAWPSDLDATQDIPFRIIGKPRAPANIAALSGAVLRSDVDFDGLVIDFAAEEIRSGNGDLLRRLTREAGFDWTQQIQSSIDRRRFLNALRAVQEPNKLQVVFPFGDNLYFEQDPVSIAIHGRTQPFVTVFSLSADGKVGWIYPRYPPYDRTGYFNDPPGISPADLLRIGPFRVSPPFGAEYVVVVESPEELPALRRAVARHAGQGHLRAFWQDIVAAMKDREFSLAIHAFFTAETTR